MDDVRSIKFWLNDKLIEETSPKLTMRAVSYLRTTQQLCGTKIGCQEGDCGACAILLGEPKSGDDTALRYRAVLSCILPLGELAARHVVTIEGLSFGSALPLPLVAQTMKEFGAVQCGFCSPGFVISLTSGLLADGEVTRDSLIRSAEGNICRCTGYRSIRSAIHALADRYGAELSRQSGRARLVRLVELGVLPAYFLRVAEELPASSSIPIRLEEHTTLIAGGTDLLVGEKWDEKLLGDGETPVFLGRLENLRGITSQGGTVVIGAATKWNELAESPLVSRFFSAGLALMASEPLRRQATVAGNIVNASPIGDLSVMLLAMGAELVIRQHAGEERTVALDEFFLDYRRTVLKKCEVVTQIRLAPSAPDLARCLFHFEKVATRTYLDIATVNSAIILIMDGNIIKTARLSAGGVAPIPLALKKTAAHLVGKALTAPLVCEAAQLAMQEITPISDVRGSAQYKRELLGRLVIAHFMEIFGQDQVFTKELTHEI